jgi:hypothetical protein
VVEEAAVDALQRDGFAVIRRPAMDLRESYDRAVEVSD